jgi:hypothetical protein
MRTAPCIELMPSRIQKSCTPESKGHKIEWGRFFRGFAAAQAVDGRPGAHAATGRVSNVPVRGFKSRARNVLCLEFP